MVEYESSDPCGQSRTLRLYAGSSWTEELLGEPTTIYWDFDNPKNFASDGPTPASGSFPMVKQARWAAKPTVCPRR